MGLVKPLEDGDRGTPLTVSEAEGDLESRSDARRIWWGVGPVYRLRAVKGDGRADERDDAIPGEAVLSGNGISSCAQSWCCCSEWRFTYIVPKRGLISGEKSEGEK